MGQRHQIYIVIPYEFSQYKDWEREEFVESNIVALHHQWLYGVSACQQLLQFLEFCKKGKNDDYFIFNENGRYSGSPEQAASALYSLNFENGDFQSVLIEPHELTLNPRYGDNNDGITIIDLRGKQPKYCFMFIGSGGYNGVEHFKSLSANEYMEEYYGDKILENPEENDYWQRNITKFHEFQKEMNRLIDKFSLFEVLSTEEVKLIFPKMFEEKF